MDTLFPGTGDVGFFLAMVVMPVGLDRYDEVKSGETGMPELLESPVMDPWGSPSDRINHAGPTGWTYGVPVPVSWFRKARA